MMDAVIIMMVVWLAVLSVVTLFLLGEGTKGIESKPYYGRKTGTKYTAKKDRERYIV